ncbi:MAG: hypothetical protein V3V09_03355 [Arenicellales bacterium]
MLSYKTCLRAGITVTALALTACSEHRGENITQFTGDYRYKTGIGEFFDCASAKKYYVINTAEHQKIIKQYLALNILQNNDVYIRVKGYFKEVIQLDGIDPSIEFAPVKLQTINADRGCSQQGKHGL